MGEMHNLATSEKQGKQSIGIKVGMVILYLLMCSLVCTSLCLHGTVCAIQASLIGGSKRTQSDQFLLLTFEQNIIRHYFQEKITFRDLNIQILIIHNAFITNTCKENIAM